MGCTATKRERREPASQLPYRPRPTVTADKPSIAEGHGEWVTVKRHPKTSPGAGQTFLGHCSRRLCAEHGFDDS